VVVVVWGVFGKGGLIAGVEGEDDRWGWKCGRGGGGREGGRERGVNAIPGGGGGREWKGDGGHGKGKTESGTRGVGEMVSGGISGESVRGQEPRTRAKAGGLHSQPITPMSFIHATFHINHHRAHFDCNIAIGAKNCSRS
jgi:hypothetical protein